MSAQQVDVLVVGGGLQGVSILHELKKKSFSVLLVSEEDLGVGQTLHSHVYLHKGHSYQNPELIRVLQRAHSFWGPFVQEHTLDVIESEALYIASRASSLLLEEFWTKQGLQFETTTMPDILRDGLVGKWKAYRSDTKWVSGEQLLESLCAEYKHCLKRGNVLRLVDTKDRPLVTVQTAGAQETIEPKMVVLAAGCGNHTLLAGMGSQSRPGKIHLRTRASQMLVVRSAVLPRLGFFQNDFGWSTVWRSDNDEIVWLFSADVDPETPHPDPAQGDPPVDTERLRLTVDALRLCAPAIFDTSARFGVYTGYKAEIEKDGHARMHVERLGNIISVWPYKLTLVPLATAEVVACVQEQITPRSAQVSEDVPVAQIAIGAEKWRLVKCSSWDRFREHHGL